MSIPKNKKRLEANQRKKAANDKLSRFGVDIEDPLLTIGFFVDDLLPSQKKILMLENINMACKEACGINFCIFQQNTSPTFMPVLCPIMDHKLLLSFKHPIITTSLSTTKDVLVFNDKSRIFYYVFDLEIFHNYFDFFEIANNDRVIIIARGEDHRQLIQRELNKKVYVVKDFCLEDLIKRVLEDDKERN